MGVGSTEDLVTSNLCGDDLADDVTVGEADNEAVFWSIVFVLRLLDEATSSVVVGLS